MNEKQLKMWKCLIAMDTETAVRQILCVTGDQLLDDFFYNHLVNEGYDLPIEEDDEEEYEE